MPAWYVYLVRCRDGTLYTGATTDVEARVAVHNAGRGARYTAARRPVREVYREPCEDRSAALAREAAIKALTRAAKLALIRGRSAGFKVQGSGFRVRHP